MPHAAWAFHFQCRMPPKRLPLGWKDWGIFCLPQVFALPLKSRGGQGLGALSPGRPRGHAHTTCKGLLRVPGFKRGNGNDDDFKENKHLKNHPWTLSCSTKPKPNDCHSGPIFAAGTLEALDSPSHMHQSDDDPTFCGTGQGELALGALSCGQLTAPPSAWTLSPLVNEQRELPQVVLT